MRVGRLRTRRGERTRGTCRHGSLQRGALLIEGLVAIGVFSIGILAILTLVLKLTVNSSEARYRVEAAQVAESLVSEMRVADPATRVANYGSGGASYTAWLARIRAAGGLPLSGAASGVVPLVVAFDGSGQVVTVTINWRAPQDSATNGGAGVPHRYVTSTCFE